MITEGKGRRRKETEWRKERNGRIGDGWEWAGEEKEKDGKGKGTGTSACRTPTKFIIFLC